MSGSCDDLAELRSGFVDGALSPGDRERVVTHLLGCADCRSDVAELRAVRDLLGRTARSTPAPTPLSERLVSIAGDASARPWTKAFDGAAGVLPSGRHRARVRALLGVLAVGAVTTALGLTGWFAAPVGSLAAVADPADEAQAEFGAAAAELSVTGASLSALMLLDSLPEATRDADGVARPSTRGDRLAGRAASVELLERALAAGRTTTVQGDQTVLARIEEHRVVAAHVGIDTRSRQGTLVSVFDPAGALLASSFAPAQVAASGGPSPVDLIADAYTLSASSGVQVAGRTASVVEARDARGRVAKRWWVDEATGVLLWQESYDDDGLSTAAGFTDVRVVPYAAVPAPRTSTRFLTTGLASASAARLSSSGWDCSEELAGLDLLEVTTDTPTDPSSVHAVYGDGASTVSVLQRHGRLARPPSGAAWDDGMQVWRHKGAVRWATWQSGDTVYTVTTDGSTQLLRRAVRAFPHEGPMETTTLGRVREGWSRILADLKG